jgi:hypothetical protein
VPERPISSQLWKRWRPTPQIETLLAGPSIAGMRPSQGAALIALGLGAAAFPSPRCGSPFRPRDALIPALGPVLMKVLAHLETGTCRRSWTYLADALVIIATLMKALAC